MLISIARRVARATPPARPKRGVAQRAGALHRADGAGVRPVRAVQLVMEPLHARVEQGGRVRGIRQCRDQQHIAIRDGRIVGDSSQKEIVHDDVYAPA